MVAGLSHLYLLCASRVSFRSRPTMANRFFFIVFAGNQKTEIGRQKNGTSGDVGAEAYDCEDERSRWADRKGEG